MGRCSSVAQISMFYRVFLNIGFVCAPYKNTNTIDNVNPIVKLVVDSLDSGNKMERLNRAIDSTCS